MRSLPMGEARGGVHNKLTSGASYLESGVWKLMPLVWAREHLCGQDALGAISGSLRCDEQRRRSQKQYLMHIICSAAVKRRRFKAGMASLCS